MTSSAFIGNTALTIGAQIDAVTAGGVVDAAGNYWSEQVRYPDQIAYTVSYTSPLTSDPTTRYATGFYYDTSAPACAMHLPDSSGAVGMIPTPTLIPWDPGQFESMMGIPSGCGGTSLVSGTGMRSRHSRLTVFAAYLRHPFPAQGRRL